MGVELSVDVTASLDELPSEEELLSADDELLLPAVLESVGPPSGEVPLLLLGTSLLGLEIGLEVGGRGTVQPGCVVVVVVDVEVGGVVVDVGGVVVPHEGRVVVGVVVDVDVRVVVFVVVVVGFGAFVDGVCFGGTLPIDGGPIASASVSGSTGSAGIGSTPRAYASAQESTVAT